MKHYKIIASDSEEGFMVGDKEGISFVIRPFIFILVIWTIFWLDQRFMLDLYQFGIFPRHIDGLFGVVTSPLLHGSLTHISNNTIPILALGMGLFFFYPRIASSVVIVSWLTSGLAVWIIGRESYHIGASSLIYALAGFIFLSGVLRRQGNLLALSLLVVFLYGGLIWGLFPVKDNVSWEAHLAGGLSGFGLALFFRKVGPKRRIYSWELDEEIMENIPEVEKQPNLDPDKEAWEEYAKSLHGIRYIYKKDQPDPHKNDP